MAPTKGAAGSGGPNPGGDDEDPRQSFQEIMEMAELPSAVPGVKRYMSRRPGWMPGSDLDDVERFCGPGKPFRMIPMGSFGGQVYSQAALAACRTVDEEERARGLEEGQKRFGLHTVHGYFTVLGFTDRPFIYEVTPISNQRSFITRLVVVRQGLDRSSDPKAERFPLSDADAEPGAVCFTALVSFKLPEPDSAGVSTQEPSPQARFADILSARRPEDWTPSPPLDVDAVMEVVGRDVVGLFPAVDMRKVDMRAYNADKPLHEKRELLLYRILRPFPVRSAEDANAHALVHAYEADRNGLLMAGNFMGFGHGLKKVGSLSYSFVVHTNIEALQMRHGSERRDAESEWWIQEVIYPRTGSGRVMLESKIWSPDGTHVATEYQDGICTAQEELIKKSDIQRGKL